MNRLILVEGQEGAGKSTIIRAMLPETPQGAAVDAEDVGQVNPCPYDAAFFDLLRRNVAALVANSWRAGYRNVITGSCFANHEEYVAFRTLLTSPVEVYVVQLIVAWDVRNHRRLNRAKQTTQEWRDEMDQIDIEDTTLRAADGDYRYIGIDNSTLTVAQTVSRIKQAIPEIYGSAR